MWCCGRLGEEKTGKPIGLLGASGLCSGQEVG